MSVYPLTGHRRSEFRVDEQWHTLISDKFRDPSKEQRRSFSDFPTRVIYVPHRLNTTNAAILREALRGLKGAYGTITFFWPFSADWFGEYIGVGDGSTTVFDLPGKDINEGTLDVTGSGDYTFGDGTGTDGRDKITCDSAPSVGTVIYADFTGTLGLWVRLLDDKWLQGTTGSEENASGYIHNIEVTLKEVRV